MTFKNRTLQQKVKGKWQVINVTMDPDAINELLISELIVRFIFHKRQVKKIQYTGIGLIVWFDRKTKAVYTK